MDLAPHGDLLAIGQHARRSRLAGWLVGLMSSPDCNPNPRLKPKRTRLIVSAGDECRELASYGLVVVLWSCVPLEASSSQKPTEAATRSDASVLCWFDWFSSTSILANRHLRLWEHKAATGSNTIGNNKTSQHSRLAFAGMSNNMPG